MWPFNKKQKRKIQREAELGRRIDMELEKLLQALDKYQPKKYPFQMRLETIKGDALVWGYDTARKRNAAATIMRNNLENGYSDVFKDTDGRIQLVDHEHIMMVGENDEA